MSLRQTVLLGLCLLAFLADGPCRAQTLEAAATSASPWLQTAPQTLEDPARPQIPSPAVSYKSLGTATIGTLVVPFQSEWLALLGINHVLTCQGSILCDRYELAFLRTHLDLAFSNEPFLENGYTRPPEHHLPYLNFTLHAVELRFYSWLRISVANAQLRRAPRFLYDDVNFQATVAHARFEFLSIERRWVQSECWLELGGPGVKYVKLAAFEVVPFIGLNILHGQQGCQLALGKRSLSFTAGYALQTNVSLGQSGDGEPLRPGKFGAIHGEYRGQFHAGVNLAAPSTLQRAGILQFHLMGLATIRLHLEDNCIYDTDPNALSCSNNTNYYEVQFGLQLGMDLGLPAGLATRQSRFTPGRWPGYAL